MTNNIGPRMEPCGIPLFTVDQDEYSLFTLTHCVLLLKNALTQLTVIPTIPMFSSFLAIFYEARGQKPLRNTCKVR